MSAVVNVVNVASVATDEALIADAYARVKADLAALTPDELVRVNLDVPLAEATILGVLPALKALRDRMAKELPTFNVAEFDKLEDYVLALGFTQAALQMATLPPDDLQSLLADATKMREQLLADAKSLSLHGLFDPQKLEQLKGINGYRNVAQDLQALCFAMQDTWAQIQERAATTAEELLEASRVGTRLMRVIGVREQGPALVAAATDQRQRAFTRVFHTYEDARHAVAFLRRLEGDADSIAPSLYVVAAKHRSDPVPAADEGTPAPVVNGPAPVPAGGTGAQTTGGSAPAAAANGLAASSTSANRGPFAS
jgi:hypothetical protein